MTTDQPKRFVLQSIYDDGTVSEPEIVPVTRVPLDTTMARRDLLRIGGLFGTGVSAALITNPSRGNAQGKTQTKPNRVEADTARKAEPDKVKSALPTKVLAHRASIRVIAVSPNGDLLVSGDSTGTVKLWSLPEAKLLRTKKLRYGTILGLAFGQNAESITIVGSRTIGRWLTETGRLQPDSGLRQAIKSVAFSRDGSFLVFATRSGKVQIYRPDAREKLGPSIKFQGAIDNLNISPDGSLLIANKRRGMELYSLPEFVKITDIAPAGTNVPRHVDISPDQQHLAVARETAFGTRRGKITLLRLPDTAQRTKLKRLDKESGPVYSFTTTAAKLKTGELAGHTRGVKAMEFLSNDAVLITGESTGYGARRRRSSRFRKRPLPRTLQGLKRPKTIKIWSTRTRSLIQSLDGNATVSDLAIDARDRVMASSGRDGTIMIWDREKSADAARFRFRTFLFDPSTMSKNEQAVQFKVQNQLNFSGMTSYNYTLPCGSPIPAGAVCTCNCVSGTYTRPVRRRRRSYTYCSCNKICTCMAVCQAHKLLHDDNLVRLMSEQLLFIMGYKEADYMRWAAEQSPPELRRRIVETIDEVLKGAKPAVSSWPSLEKLFAYLDDADEAVAIMAAQMSVYASLARRQSIPEEQYLRIERLLWRSHELHWLKRKQQDVENAM